MLVAPGVVLGSVRHVASGFIEPFEDPGGLEDRPSPSGQLPTALLSWRREPDAVMNEVVATRSAAVEAPQREVLANLVDANSCVYALDDEGDVIFSHRPHEALIPASNEKLLVAATATEVLGADFKFVTTLRSAPPQQGVIAGPLYLVGGGDALLSTRSFAERQPTDIPVATIDALVDQLRQRGITKVVGDIVGVDARYDQERRAPTWSALTTSFDVAPLSALVVDHGRDGGGSVPNDPALTAARLLRNALRAAGIDTGGTVRSIHAGDEENAAVAEQPAIATIGSPPLKLIVRDMLIRSDNLVAELLLKELGRTDRTVGSRQAGLQVVRRHIEQWGIRDDGLVIADGSGLSRENRLTCRALVDLLSGTVVGRTLDDDLAIAGRSGTLAGQLIDSPAEGTMRAKTGTLFDVKALTGVQPDASGDEATFSVILNGPDSNSPPRFGPVWSALAELIAVHDKPIGLERSAFSPRPLAPTTASTSPPRDRTVDGSKR